MTETGYGEMIESRMIVDTDRPDANAAMSVLGVTTGAMTGGIGTTTGIEIGTVTAATGTAIATEMIGIDDA